MNLDLILAFAEIWCITCEEQLRTFKHIQRNLNYYYHALILNSHHGNTKQVREKDYTFMQDPYGGGEDSW